MDIRALIQADLRDLFMTQPMSPEEKLRKIALRRALGRLEEAIRRAHFTQVRAAVETGVDAPDAAEIPLADDRRIEVVEAQIRFHQERLAQTHEDSAEARRLHQVIEFIQKYLA